jgi:hypothetical protein
MQKEIVTCILTTFNRGSLINNILIKSNKYQYIVASENNRFLLTA